MSIEQLVNTTAKVVHSGYRCVVVQSDLLGEPTLIKLESAFGLPVGTQVTILSYPYPYVGSVPGKSQSVNVPYHVYDWELADWTKMKQMFLAKGYQFDSHGKGIYKSEYLYPAGTQLSYVGHPNGTIRYAAHWSWYASSKKCADESFVQCLLNGTAAKQRPAAGESSDPIYKWAFACCENNVYYESMYIVYSNNSDSLYEYRRIRFDTYFHKNYLKLLASDKMKAYEELSGRSYRGYRVFELAVFSDESDALRMQQSHNAFIR